MERITFEGNFCDISMCRENPCPYNGMCSQRKTWERLKEYEKTGLDPEEIYEVRFLIAAQRDPQKLARLSNLVLADQEGRLVVLPCKVGDTVYVIDKGDYTHAFKPYVRSKTVREISWKATSRKDLGWGLILSGGDCGTSARYKLSSIGKTVFLTREEAEAELAQKGGDR